MGSDKPAVDVFPVMGVVLGPFRAKDPNNHWEVEKNIRNAEGLLLRLWQHGIPVVCPHTNTRFFQGAADDRVWLQGYQQILKKADFVICVCSWRGSAGTRDEVLLAKRLGIPVYEEAAFSALLSDLRSRTKKYSAEVSTADLDMRDKHGQKP